MAASKPVKIFAGVGAATGVIAALWYFLRGREEPLPPGCEIDADCLPGYICVDGVCVEEGPECVIDTDCPVGYFCVDGKCIPEEPECDATHPCLEGYICEDGVCVPVAVANVKIIAMDWEGGGTEFYVDTQQTALITLDNLDEEAHYCRIWVKIGPYGGFASSADFNIGGYTQETIAITMDMPLVEGSWPVAVELYDIGAGTLMDSISAAITTIYPEPIEVYEEVAFLESLIWAAYSSNYMVLGGILPPVPPPGWYSDPYVWQRAGYLAAYQTIRQEALENTEARNFNDALWGAVFARLSPAGEVAYEQAVQAYYAKKGAVDHQRSWLYSPLSYNLEQWERAGWYYISLGQGEDAEAIWARKADLLAEAEVDPRYREDLCMGMRSFWGNHFEQTYGVVEGYVPPELPTAPI